MEIHALSGIRTHDASVRGGEESSCLRQRGYLIGGLTHIAKVIHPITSANLEHGGTWEYMGVVYFKEISAFYIDLRKNIRQL
jgi:hypothetical protein